MLKIKIKLIIKTSKLFGIVAVDNNCSYKVCDSISVWNEPRNNSGATEALTLHHTVFNYVTDAHKRSLPNLSKTGHLGLPPPPNLTQHPSDRDSTPSDESSDTPSTQISQPIYRSGLRRPSPKVTTPASRSPQGSPTPYKSPVASIAAAPRSGIPTPKAVSSIPRPNSASKLRAPSKSVFIVVTLHCNCSQTFIKHHTGIQMCCLPKSETNKTSLNLQRYACG